MSKSLQALVLSLVGAGVALALAGLVVAQVVVHVVEKLAEVVVRT